MFKGEEGKRDCWRTLMMHHLTQVGRKGIHNPTRREQYVYIEDEAISILASKKGDPSSKTEMRK